jgi:hypothetical protein
VHHPKPRSQKVADDPKAKAQEERQRREAAIANTTGIRTLAAIAEAVPVRLMKRDLLFVAERLASLLDENRLSIIARRYGINKAKDSDSLVKLFAAYLRRAEESVMGSILIESTILYMSTRHNPAQVLNEAATVYRGEYRCHSSEGQAGGRCQGEVEEGSSGGEQSQESRLSSLYEGLPISSPSFRISERLRGVSPASIARMPPGLFAAPGEPPSVSPGLSFRFAAGLRSPGARQEDVPLSCTFPPPPARRRREACLSRKAGAAIEQARKGSRLLATDPCKLSALS